MSEKTKNDKQFDEFASEKRTVTIHDKDYPLREMSLAGRLIRSPKR